ncbi:MAG: hypothetical protein WC375_06825, partial [Methanomassiliicoccales archaeon]
MAKEAGLLDGTATVVDTAVSGDPDGTIKGLITIGSDGSSSWYTMVTIEKRGEGDHCEVWVATNLFYASGDPRNVNASRFNITDDQVTYIIEEFDDNIFVKMSDFFGVPVARNGSEALVNDYFGGGPYDTFNNTDGGKTMIVVLNIKDEGYYDPSYDYYIAGFFSPTVDEFYDRNIIHIDCYDWENRTGDQTATDPRRSYAYEGTIAHEYQHLIHNGYDPSEENFINEGCSDYAEIVCGYGLLSLSDHIGNFLNEPSNSLTLWGDGDQLADYGAAALFTIYLNDKFGGAATIQALVKSNLTGTASVTDVLDKQGFEGWTFDKVFKQWRIANYLDSNQPGNGKYKYDTLNLADIGAMHAMSLSLNHGTDREVGAYGTDYIETARGYMRTRERLQTYADFEGSSIDPYAGWINEDVYWQSSQFDQSDSVIRGSIDLRGTEDTTHTLSIETWYDIEENWDFGFVQVSTDGGLTWTSLENDETTEDYDSGAMDTIVEQLPGITGYSGGIVWLDFDISAYDEQFIMVQFRYMTDWATTYEGWQIGEIYLDGEYYDSAYDEDYFEPVYTSINWFVSVVLFHNNLPIGIVDLKANVYNGITAGYAPPMDDEYIDMSYRP